MPKSNFHGLFENSTAQFVNPGHWMVPPGSRHLTKALLGEEGGIFIADLSGWSKIEIHAQDASSVVNASSTVWRLAPNKYLSVVVPGNALTTAFANQSTIQTDVTSVYAHFLILGRAIGDLLAKLSSLSLVEDPLLDCPCLQGSVARIRCIVRGDNQYQVSAFHLLCSRDFGASLCVALLRAGREFSITLIDEAELDSIRASGHQSRVRP